MNELAKSLIAIEENLFLEFKSKWYWENDDKEISKSWGELLKDLVALINCDSRYVNENKYLIIGVDESKIGSERVVDISLDANGNKIRKLENLEQLKEDILDKLNNHFTITDFKSDIMLDFNIHSLLIENKKILFFEIKPTTQILVLKKDLQDKKTTTRKNSVFIRTIKSDGEPQVDIANPDAIAALKESVDIYKSERESDRKKEINIEKTISLFIKKNNSFHLETPLKKRDWESNIQYEIFPVKSKFVNIDFIYLYDKTSQQKTYDYLIAQKVLTKSAQKYILIDEKLKKDNLKKIFDTDDVYYVEEFGRKHIYNDYFDDDIFHQGNFNIQTFIEPYTTHSEDKTAYSILLEWFEKVSNPLIVIKGYGGVGKTTLVKYFLDNIVKSSTQDSNVLFINSNEILDDIVRYSGIDDLFHFYEALAKKRKANKIFDKALLELSVDNGNLLIVLDGIDEVIAKAGNRFNIDKFITSIYENYTSGSEKTKIIITCRDFFWDSNINHNDINTLELKPFNHKLTTQFFSNKFGIQSKEFTKALALAQEFALSNNNHGGEDIYIPYILDLIADIILRDKQFGSNSSRNLDSNILAGNITNDYLVGRVCEREITKLENTLIDEQINLFTCLAVNFNGAINLTSLHKFNHYLEKKLDPTLIDKFKGHPILTTTDETLLFRYDFFTVYFKNLYISRFFIEKDINKMDKNFIEILGEYIRYDNSFTENICKRLQYDDVLKIFTIDIIEKITSELQENDDLEKRKISSSILIFLLVALRMSDRPDNIENRTELLKEIFGTNTMQYLSIINLFVGESKAHPTFDFSNIEFNNCWFENYEFFWECKMDANTKFKHSTFRHLIPRKDVKPKFYEGMFDRECDTSDIAYIIDNQREEYELKENKIINQLKKIIKYFEQGGTFKDKKIADVRSKFDTNILDILIKRGVIDEYVNYKKTGMGKQYRIHPEYNGLIKVLEQGGSYFEFEKILTFFDLPYSTSD